jgi:hypothetical protein
MSKLSRNAPCHCGSGEKYKKCCLPSEAAKAPTAAANEMIEQALAGQQFESLSDAQIFIDHKMAQFNDRPQDDFYGLSSTQVQQLISAPLEQQNLVGWQAEIDEEALSKTPIIQIYLLLKEQLAQPVKATVKGYLPPAVVKRIFSQAQASLPHTGRSFGFEKVNKETDYNALHITRLLLLEAGLIKYQKQHFSLTQRAIKLSTAQVYQRLFSHYGDQYNWGYEDAYAEAPFFHRTTNYALWQLQQLQLQQRTDKLTSDQFAEHILDSFPVAIDEFEDDPYRTAYQQASRCYELRLLERYWQFFGLVNIAKSYRDQPRTMAINPLFNQLFWFEALK